MVFKEAVEIIGRDELIEVVYESVPIQIYFKAKHRIRDLETEVLSLRKSLTEIQSQMKFLKVVAPSLTDEDAEKTIRDVLRKKKMNGIKRVDILSIMEETKIPVEQVSRIMKFLEKSGVKEVS